jgi:hypothetical protein
MDGNQSSLPVISGRFLNKSLLVKVVGGIITVGGISFALPYLVSAFLGGMTIVGLGIVALITALGSRFVPLLFQAVDNAALGLRKANARNNPIEQLQNSYIKGCESRDKKVAYLTDYATEIKNMQDELKISVSDFSDQDWSETEKAIKHAQDDYETQSQAVAELEESLVEMDKVIKVWERKLKMAESTQKLRTKGGGNAKEEVVLQLLNDEAAREIASRVNRSMAVMEVDSNVKSKRAAIREQNGAKKLSDKAM